MERPSTDQEPTTPVVVVLVVTVLVPDQPGELARLLAEVGAAGINLEELQLEHAPRQAVGLAAVSVLRGLGGRLEQELTARGWRLAG